jgi:hypothetical protein
MAAQARVLRVTTGGESPVIITARACLAPPRLLAQALNEAQLLERGLPINEQLKHVA